MSMFRLLLALLLAPAAAMAAGPCYFTAVLNGGEGDRAESYKALGGMVKMAEDQGVRLTLLFSPDYALYVATDAARLAELEGWKAAGNEVGAWYEGAGDQAWLAKLEPVIKTACAGGVEPATAAVYGVCGLEAGRGDGGPALPGVNDYVYVSSGGARLLSGARPSDKPAFDAAKAAFGGMKGGLYGAVFRGLPSEYGAFYAWLGFLRTADPGGGMSRTVFSAAGGGVLTEKALAARAPAPRRKAKAKAKAEVRTQDGYNDPGAPPKLAIPVPAEAQQEGAQEKQELPKLRPINSFYGRVGRNDFMPLGKKAAGYCGDGVCDAAERVRKTCTADCGK